MTQSTGRRRRLSGAQEKELWTRWKKGESLPAIGRALSTQSRCLYAVVARHGGIAPLPRTRSDRALTVSEREEISRGLAAEQTVRAIAARGGVRRRRSVARFSAMADANSIVPSGRTPRLGTGLGGPSAAGSPNSRRCAPWWQRSLLRSGRPNKSPGGW